MEGARWRSWTEFLQPKGPQQRSSAATPFLLSCWQPDAPPGPFRPPAVRLSAPGHRWLQPLAFCQCQCVYAWEVGLLQLWKSGCCGGAREVLLTVLLSVFASANMTGGAGEVPPRTYGSGLTCAFGKVLSGR